MRHMSNETKDYVNVTFNLMIRKLDWGYDVKLPNEYKFMRKLLWDNGRLLLQCRMIDLKEYYTTIGLMVTTLVESIGKRLFIPFTNPFLLQCV